MHKLRLFLSMSLIGVIILAATSCITINNPAPSTPTPTQSPSPTTSSSATPTQTLSPTPSPSSILATTPSPGSTPTSIPSPAPTPIPTSSDRREGLIPINSFVAIQDYNPAVDIRQIVKVQSEIDQIFRAKYGITYYGSYPDLSKRYEPHDSAKLQVALSDIRALTQWKYVANKFDCSNMSALTQFYLANAGFKTVMVVGADPNNFSGHAWVVVLISNPTPEAIPVEATTPGGPAIPSKGAAWTYTARGVTGTQTYDDYITKGWAVQDIYQATAWSQKHFGETLGPDNQFNWWDTTQLDWSLLPKTGPMPSPTPTSALPLQLPSLAVDPATASSGTVVTIKGQNFTSGGSIPTLGITVGGLVGNSGPIPLDAAGSFSYGIILSGLPSGTYTIQATDNAGKRATATLIVAITQAPRLPSLSLTPTSGSPGTQMTVRGYDFTPYATVKPADILFGGTPSSGPTFNVDGTGSIAFTLTVGATRSSGNYDVVVTDSSGKRATATFTVNARIPRISVTQTKGSPGDSITVIGSVFASSETGISVIFDSTVVASGISANVQGNWTATFVVPPSAAGSHGIRASGASTPATLDIVFTVVPTVSISRSSGAPGSSVVVTGNGFGASETGITVTYDGSVVASGISANAQGGWTATFVVPPSAAGSHVIHVAGSRTSAVATPDVVFTVIATPTVSISRSSGAPGSTVTVTGNGFGASETGITVTYDGSAVASGISANAQGGWTATFVIPPSAAGSHGIHASGASTPATPDIVFTVVPAVSISQSSGAPGSSVTITGNGFGSSETGITVTYDGTTVASGISANAQGSWTATFVVPPSATGSHVIHVVGSRTSAAATPDILFTVIATPTVSISRSSGAPGNSVIIAGNGFGANETGISVTFDSTVVASGISANAQGSWAATFVIPPSTAGSHVIHVSGRSTTPDIVFTIIATPTVSISRSSGAPGVSVTVTGNGFGAGETGISVTFDSMVVASGIVANAQGSWTATFVVPPSAAGSHVIQVSGSSTPAASIPSVMFIVIS